MPKVFSMFDGVGGFIVGLDNANKELGRDFYTTLYSNQFEPSRKAQDAFEVALYRFPDMQHIGKDVATITDDEFLEMKENGVDMIVAGFPCQDYSVARSKKNEQGIEGKKGVLFWEIIRAVHTIEPKYLILENVDRLLKSPSKQRGRDFAIMLGAFNQLGYSVEWRVINAADYGRGQRRRRVFFFIYRNDVPFAQHISSLYSTPELNLFNDEDIVDMSEYIFKDGLFARQFPIKPKPYKNRVFAQQLSALDDQSSDYILDISDHFTGQIWNSGIMRYGHYYTIDTEPIKEESLTLGEIVQQAAVVEPVDESYYLDEDKVKKFQYLRGPKKLERKSATGHVYQYSEGGMSEFDSFDLPARTMLTSEGTVNRSSHFLKDENGYRTLTPVEAELIQDFPANWTKYKLHNNEKVEVSNRMRMFFMGNALVTGIVKRIGIELGYIIEEY